MNKLTWDDACTSLAEMKPSLFGRKAIDEAKEQKQEIKLAFTYLSDVALRMENDDVQFRRKETGQRDCSAQANRDTYAGDAQR